MAPFTSSGQTDLYSFSIPSFISSAALTKYYCKCVQKHKAASSSVMLVDIESCNIPGLPLGISLENTTLAHSSKMLPVISVHFTWQKEKLKSSIAITNNLLWSLGANPFFSSKFVLSHTLY